MTEENLYSLVFLFDGAQISSDDLNKRAARAIGRHLSDVDLQVKHVDSQRLQLCVVGSLDDVDTCHRKINGELFERHSCVRLRDEAGDEIRQQAYPILARMEQLLRDFINRSMTEVVGFDWWASMAPPSIRIKTSEVEKKIGELASIHHPLEFTDFDHLVEIVTGSVQEWPENREVSTADLAEVLLDCHSIEEVQAKLSKKMRRISLWDTVFVSYVREPEQWNELAKSIRELVIPLRNKVMHHRPVWLYELRKLQSAEESLRDLLASAKKELSEEERVEAQRISKDFFELMRRRQEELARALGPIRRQQEEWVRILEPIQRQQEEWARTLGPIRRQQEEWVRMLEPIRKQQEELVQAMLGPIRRQQEILDRALEPIRRLQEQMTRTAQQIGKRTMPIASEGGGELEDFGPGINSIEDNAEQSSLHGESD
jgi:hypothetical protein